jgi:hypothetical protein
MRIVDRRLVSLIPGTRLCRIPSKKKTPCTTAAQADSGFFKKSEIPKSRSPIDWMERNGALEKFVRPDQAARIRAQKCGSPEC